MSKKTMSNSVGISEVEQYLDALFFKPGIEIAKINYFALNPLPTMETPKWNPKYIVIDLAIKVPIEATIVNGSLEGISFLPR
ncbi:MAG: hypothetical protein LWX51_02445 [Deltaproteobacteria bacterium]|jgi:hypothetical protein|nr:hypothetical protein [Deltaproteobacteria bacterium]